MSSLLLKSIQINRHLQASQVLELENQKKRTEPSVAPKRTAKKARIQKYKTFEEAAVAVQKLNILTSQDYTENYKQDPLLPANPMEYYADFKEKGAWDTYLNRIHNAEQKIRRDRKKLGSSGLLLPLSTEKVEKALLNYAPKSDLFHTLIALAILDRVSQYFAVIDYKKRPILTLSLADYCKRKSATCWAQISQTFESAVALDRVSSLGIAAWELCNQSTIKNEDVLSGLTLAAAKLDDPTMSGMYWDLNNSMSRSRMAKVINRVAHRIRQSSGVDTDH